jgi:hypothetical protein
MALTTEQEASVAIISLFKRSSPAMDGPEVVNPLLEILEAIWRQGYQAGYRKSQIIGERVFEQALASSAPAMPVISIDKEEWQRLAELLIYHRADPDERDRNLLGKINRLIERLEGE